MPGVYVAAFTVTFTYQSTPNPRDDLKGLDGIAFVVQTEDWETTIGPAGGGLAYGEGALDGRGITNCVAVELDTYKDPAPISDPDGNHIAVHASNGSDGISAREPGVALTNAVPRLNDGEPHNVTIVYQRGTLTVYFGEILGPVLPNVAIDIEAVVGGPTAWIGFTGSIGSSGGDGHTISYFSYTYGGVLTPSNSLVTGIGNQLSLSAGDNVTFSLQARDQYGNPCNADASLPTVATEEGTPVTTWFTPLGDGLFTVSFFITESGLWTLDIMLDGVAVSSGPVALDISPGACTHTPHTTPHTHHIRACLSSSPHVCLLQVPWPPRTARPLATACPSLWPPP